MKNVLDELGLYEFLFHFYTFSLRDDNEKSWIPGFPLFMSWIGIGLT